MGAGHHHHDHHHEHHDGGNGEFGHAPPPREDISRRLTWVLSITAVFMVAEIVGGVLSNSLALLADAGHMFTDVAALGLSVFAMRLASRPSTERRTWLSISLRPGLGPSASTVQVAVEVMGSQGTITEKNMF